MPEPTQFHDLPDTALVRAAEIVKSTSNPNAPVPFSIATLWRVVKSGDFPKPLKLSKRVTVWRVGDVRAWLQKGAAA